MIYLNTSDDTFPYPILKTVDDTLSYEVAAANFKDSDGTDIAAFTWNGNTVTCRSVKNVFIQTTSGFSYNPRYRGDYLDVSGINDNWSRRLARITYREVPCHLYDKTDAGNARIVFMEEPASLTMSHYVEFYMAPLELTAETIPFSLNIDEHFWIVKEGVMAQVEDIENGGTQKWNEFKGLHKPEFLRKMNRHLARKRPQQMPVRECG
jgi:hypothetical protein